MIEETADYLFTLSTSSRLDRNNQDRCYKAFVLLQSSSKTIVSEIIRAISLAFNDYKVPAVPGKDEDEFPDGRLALVALEEFEDTLAIEKIVRAGTERFWLEMESVMLRIAKGLGIPPDAVELPVSPRTICSAYRQSLKNLEFPRAFLVDADSAFVRKLLPELATIYQALNDYLISLDLLPEIEEHLKTTGSQILIKATEPSDPRAQAEPHVDVDPRAFVRDGLSVPEQGSANTHSEASLIHSNEWVDAIASQMLAGDVSTSVFRRQSLSAQIPPDTLLSAAGGRATFAPTRLEPISRDSDGRDRMLASAKNLINAEQLNTAEIEAEALRLARELAELRRKRSESRYSLESILDAVSFTPKPSIHARLTEAFKISSGLFNFVFDRVAPPPKMQAPLSNLELCFLELSLADQHFLIEGDHPGRILIDRIADVVSLMPRGKERNLEEFIEILDALSTRFDGSQIQLSLAVDALADLSATLVRQQRLNRDRLIARENARDRIDTARSSVISIVNKVLGSTAPTQYLSQVITEGLFDHWVVGTLKGQPSTDIETTLKSLTRFTGHGDEPPDTSMDLSLAMVALGDVVDQRPATKQALIACDESRHKKAEQVAVEPPHNWGTDIDLTPEEVEQHLTSRKRLARAVDRAQKLAMDTWFLQKHHSRYRYLQLVWVNRHNTRFVFSDERGIKQRDITVLKLASELGRSLKVLSTLEQLSLVEQTLFSKLSDTRDELSQQFAEKHSHLKTRLQHELERAMRRARRMGVNDYLVDFPVPLDLSSESLSEALQNQNLHCYIVVKLTAARAYSVVNSTDVNDIGTKIAAALSSDVVPKLSIQAIDGRTELKFPLASDSAIESKEDKLILSNENSLLRDFSPKSLDDAVSIALDRIDPLAYEMRLRPVVRVSVKVDQPPQTAYLLCHSDDSKREDKNRQQFRQRDIQIAGNLIEISEACKLLESLEASGAPSTHILVNLSQETCLFTGTLDYILTLISEHTVGTSQISFVVPDSLTIRESIVCHRLTSALRSIGCHIVIENYNPTRGDSNSLEQLHASDIVLDPEFWEQAAQQEPWASVLPQTISDVHHMLGHSVIVSEPVTTARIDSSGVDYVERYSKVALAPAEFLTSLSKQLASDL